jgi:protein-L-isoaspartate(D-aspartate) O-methyltransferase
VAIAGLLPDLYDAHADEEDGGFRLWLAWGSPGRDRFGMSVTPEGQYVWLDSPDRRVRLRA